jgi:MEMO1 family protein
MGKRTSYKIPIIILSFFCAGIIIFFVVTGEDTITNLNRMNNPHYLRFQYSAYCDDSIFYAESFKHILIRNNDSLSRRNNPIRLGIISHHLLIKDLIADYFTKLAFEGQPSTIIIIGPNHRSRGFHSLAISELPWITPFGIVNPDLPIIRQLLETRFVDLDENAFYDEHSISALVPFIRKTFPKTLIVPIIIKPDADTSLILDLAIWLAKYARTSNMLILASLDFSHYQTSYIAQQQDKVSLDIIRLFDTNRWKDAFVDSRKSLLLILKLAVLTNSKQYEIIHHTNSGFLEKKPKEPCTSYINLVFRSSLGRNLTYNTVDQF